MACEIERPSPQELFDRYRNMFSTTVLGGSPIIPESNEWYVVALNYAMAEEFYSFSEQQWKERDPRYACCENLTALAAVDGVFPRAATFASGYGLITGTPGAPLPAAIEMTLAGLTYRSVGMSSSIMPLTGELVVRFRSIDAGESGNIGGLGYPGNNAVGRLTQAIPNVSRDVTVYGGSFCGGQDPELCEQFRTRYLARKAFKPRATKAFIESALLEWPCVTRICQREGTCCVLDSECNNCGDCGRTIDYYVFMDNTFECGLPPQCAVEEISEWLFGPPDQPGYGLGLMEVGVCGRIHFAQPVGLTLRISGISCVTPGALDEIDSAIRELFRTFCPSSLITVRSFETVIAQIVGNEVEFEVEIVVDPEDVANVDELQECCGAIELHCDYAACLTEIVFVDEPVPLGCT